MGHLTLRHKGGQFFHWDRVCYLELEDQTIISALYRFLHDAKQRGSEKDHLEPFAPTKQKVAEVLAAVRSETHLPIDIASMPCWLGRNRSTQPDPRELIACSNGLLHLPTLDLLPSTPAFFSTNALPFPYQPDAPEPVAFRHFLTELWPEDEESIATLQEIFGYLLVPDTRQQKMFLIVGPKRSGKGTIGRVLRELLGPSNVCGPTLASLSTNFGLQPLMLKQLAIISDARLSQRSDHQIVVERLLTMSGEDALTVDRKFKDSWTGTLPSRILILTNELPRIADASGAFASRFIVLQLTNSFYGREDHALIGRLLKELPGILNWAIAGWQRLQQRGHFIQPKAAVETAQQLDDLGSPIGTFVREQTARGPGKSVAVDNLFQAYCAWCAERKFPTPRDSQAFGRDLRAAVPGIETKQKRVEDRVVRYYTGIALP